MQLSRKDVIASLKKKGFTSREGSGHTVFVYCNTRGLKTDISTAVSRGSQYKDLRDDLISDMASQCNLSKQQFVELVKCSLSRDGYAELVEEPEEGSSL